MRYIAQFKVRRELPAQWIVKSRDLQAQLAGATPLQRARIIKANGSHWSELKHALLIASGRKCWYSEVVLSEGEAEVEHYRPKGRLSGEKFAGYWWLAFSWQNFRIASKIANARRFDRINGGLRGKGSYFPLVAGTRGNFIDPPTDDDPLGISSERALLLDPTVRSDVDLITFDQDGLPSVNPRVSDDDVISNRVKQSVDFYALDDGLLNARRSDQWKRVRQWGVELDKLFSQPVSGLAGRESDRIDELQSLIADAIDQGAEFSSVALAALKTLGNRGWNTRLALEATGP
jgi:hypothetical protein